MFEYAVIPVFEIHRGSRCLIYTVCLHRCLYRMHSGDAKYNSQLCECTVLEDRGSVHLVIDLSTTITLIAATDTMTTAVCYHQI
jgi:hypothetical protein